MPAEWEPHEATWLAWPHAPLTWPGRLKEARSEFQRLAETIAESENVFVLSGEKGISSVGLPQSSRIEIVPCATNDSWVRDYGPTFTIDAETQELVGIVWRFDAWGGKYRPFDDDASAGKEICRFQDVKTIEPNIVMEGGALESNGNGILITTESCLFAGNRNPDHSRIQIESALTGYLLAGSRQSNIISPTGAEIVGDDTDGHVDQLVRFVDEKTVVCATTHPEDVQYKSLSQNRHSLERLVDEYGIELRIVDLPVPAESIEVDGNRLPASYCNFYFTNHHLIVPQFGVPDDDNALQILKNLVKNREVIGLPSRYLLVGLGSFHCLTQQQPAGI